VASVLLNIPFFLQPFVSALGGVDKRLLETASTLGAGRTETYLRVAVPLAWRGLISGMILTFDRNKEEGKAPDIVFRRLYGKLFAHTVRREARSCESCHADPLALGFGKGKLRYAVSGTTGRWQFTPEKKASPHDGLPEDAWTGFLKAREGMVSTREGARPFSVEEQRRVLTVGACLACHAGDSPVMARAQADFAATYAARSRRCAVPDGKP